MNIESSCRLILALLLVAVFTQAARSQVNAEAFRRDDPAPGLHGRLGLGLAYLAGNSDYVDATGEFRMDYVAQDFTTFLVGNYNRRVGNNEVLENAGFAHVRFVYRLDSTFLPEAFAQKEFNDFIQLRDRNLAGAGLRVRLFEMRDSTSLLRAFIGIGAMYETEVIGSTPEVRTRLLRSTNYLSVRWKPGPGFQIGGTGYYQFASTRTSDMRVLVEAEMAIRLTDVVAFTTSARYRFDNEPPEGIEGYDLKLANGLAVTF